MIYINNFAMNSALGNAPASILARALAGDCSGIKTDEFFLGQTALLAKVDQKLQPLPANFQQYDCRASQLLLPLCEQLSTDVAALKQSYKSSRIAVVMATSTAGVDSFAHEYKKLLKNQKINKSFAPQNLRMANLAEFVAEYFALCGLSFSVSTACASANKALAEACNLLRSGLQDAVIVGAVDVLTKLTVRGFNSLGALSNQRSQPFSCNRQGINIGEGAALFIVSKNAGDFKILGCGASSDAHHISAPQPEGFGAAAAMQNALADANLTSAAVDYINLHGTGTLQNDAMEANAVHLVFGERAASVPCSSSKPQLGHALGASGALELGLCLLSMSALNREQQMLPHCYDGEYDRKLLPLALVAVGNKLGVPKIVLSNSFAFGGCNASVLISKNDSGN